MKGNIQFHENDEEHRFFDAHESIASAHSDSGAELSSSSSSDYDLWTRSPESVQQRRSKFFIQMGFNLDGTLFENQEDECGLLREEEFDRITKDSGAVLRTPSYNYEFSSSRSSMSSWCNDDSDVPVESNSDISGTSNMCGKVDCSEAELFVKENKQRKLRVLDLEQRETEFSSKLPRKINRLKKKWLNMLRSMTCIVDGKEVPKNLRPSGLNPTLKTKTQRVKVRHCRKSLKELSALFMEQDIQAHEGSILTMKFSLDGHYLATGGEDGIVRVWQVVECPRQGEMDIPDINPSCVYFTVNHRSQLSPIFSDKVKSPRRKTDSACVIFPPTVFRLLEDPVHQFYGHSGEILDLSWSKDNYLLTASTDKTIRLWQVGNEHCLKIFLHSNYVTCVQFNPVDNKHFVSGSIDGKTRIWAIHGCQVVGWTDIRDIVTAVCYRPDGQGLVVGSMTGICRFYDFSDNYFQLEAQMALHSKKKAQCKRITGFQFLPQDPTKLMVTCACSQVRMLDGINVIRKYKGLRSSGNQLLASFTPDGKHIISTSEDSNVNLWNCVDQFELSRPQPKTIRSWEWFSANASVAIPWSGFRHGDSSNRQMCALHETSPNLFALSSPSRFSLEQEIVFEPSPKGSATWPEEKLLGSFMHKSDYKFLRTCQSKSSPHVWDMVVVTAGFDGRIRSFHNYGLPVTL